MLNTVIENKNEAIMLHLDGQITTGIEIDNLKAAMNEITGSGLLKLVTNMFKLTYLNPMTIGILISSYTNLTKRGGKVILCSLSKPVDNIFSITRFTLVFPIVRTIEKKINLISK